MSCLSFPHPYLKPHWGVAERPPSVPSWPTQSRPELGECWGLGDCFVLLTQESGALPVAEADRQLIRLQMPPHEHPWKYMLWAM